MKLNLFCLAFSAPYTLCMTGGRDVYPDEGRFMVSLQQHNTDIRKRHFCAGALVSLQFVLTAASCLIGKQKKDFYILAGHNFDDDDDVFNLEIDQIFAKNVSGKNFTKDNIALIHLRIPANTGGHKVTTIRMMLDDVSPIDMMHNSVAKTDSFDYETYGWGASRQGSLRSHEHLQRAKKNALNWSSCKLAYDYIDDTNICTEHGEESDNCHYDVGNPLMHYHKVDSVIAIATEQYACINSPRNNDVYTRLTSHAHWIRSVQGRYTTTSAIPRHSTLPPPNGSTSVHKSHTIITGTLLIVLTYLSIWSIL